MSNTAKIILAVVAAVGLAALFFVVRPKGDAVPATNSLSDTSMVHVPITVKNGKVADSPGTVTATVGDTVHMMVDSDVADEVHVHGYDVMQDVKPGKTAIIEFTADTPGVFEVELEDAGLKLVDLQVEQ